MTACYYPVAPSAPLHVSVFLPRLGPLARRLGGLFRSRVQMVDGDHTRLLRALLSAVTNLDELPYPRHAGRLLLAAAVEGKGCSDDAVTRVASMPVADVRAVLPSMLDRCLHVPALLTVTVNRHPLGTTYTGIRLTGEGQRRVLLVGDHLTRA